MSPPLRAVKVAFGSVALAKLQIGLGDGVQKLVNARPLLLIAAAMIVLIGMVEPIGLDDDDKSVKSRL